MWQDIESVLLEEGPPNNSSASSCATANSGALGHPSGGVDPLGPSVSVHYHHYHPIHHPIAAHHQMSLIHPGFQPQQQQQHQHHHHNNNLNNNHHHHHQVYYKRYV